MPEAVGPLASRLICSRVRRMDCVIEQMLKFRIAAKRSGEILCAFTLLMIGGCMSGGPDGTDGGGSGGGTGTVDQVTGARLIGVNRDGICTFRLDENLQGDVEPLMVLPQGQSCLNGFLGMIINGAGQLLVLTRSEISCDIGPEEGFRFNVYADATRLNGGQQPIRVAQVTDVETNFTGGADMVIDEERDLLYIVRAHFVDGAARSEILVYANTSQAEFDGPVSPIRRFMIEAIGTSTPDELIVVDDTMYILSNAMYRIPNVSEADGTLSDDEFETVAFGGSLSNAVSHVDDNGRFYFLRIDTDTSIDTSTSGRILQYSADTTTRDRSAIISSIGFPNLLGFGSDGMIYVGAGNATGDELRIYSPIESVIDDKPFEPIRVAFNDCFNGSHVIIAD